MQRAILKKLKNSAAFQEIKGFNQRISNKSSTRIKIKFEIRSALLKIWDSLKILNAKWTILPAI